MFLVRGAACDGGSLSPEQMQAQMREVYAWIDGLTKKGVMTAAQPLTPGGKIVSGKNGSVISDGIAAESKEAVGGFFIVNAATHGRGREHRPHLSDVQSRRAGWKCARSPAWTAIEAA